MTTPTLSDERVDAMRSSVMHAVDVDIRRRGRRARGAAGLIAAVVVIGGFGVAGVNSLVGSGSDSASNSSAGSADKAVVEGGPVIGKQVAPQDVAPEIGRQVVTTGTVNVLVKKPRDVAQRLSVWVDSIGGRVDTRAENGSGDDASAFLQVRVPSAKVTATVAQLKTYGTVTDVSLQNDDVTTQSKDLDARIQALEVSTARLQKIMRDATSSSQLIEAENALTQRQEQLESLQSQRASLADRVSLSTLSIELSQKPRAESVSPGGFRGGLLDGWNALVSTVNTIVEVVGVLLPWAAIAAVLYGAYRLVAWRRRPNRR